MTIKEKYYLNKFAEASESSSNPIDHESIGARLRRAIGGAGAGAAIGGAGAGAYLPFAGWRKMKTIAKELDKSDIDSWESAKTTYPKPWKAGLDFVKLRDAKGGKEKLHAVKNFYKSLARVGTKNPKALFLKSLLGGSGVGSLLGLASSDSLFSDKANIESKSLSDALKEQVPNEIEPKNLFIEQNGPQAIKDLSKGAPWVQQLNKDLLKNIGYGTAGLAAGGGLIYILNKLLSKNKKKDKSKQKALNSSEK